MFMAAVAGSILSVDARLLGIAWPQLRLSYIAQRLLPITWIAFVGAAITGTLMFMANATNYIHNKPFLAKMILLVVVGLNMLYFHLGHVSQRGQVGYRTAGAGRAYRRTALDRAVASRGCLRRWIGFV